MKNNCTVLKLFLVTAIMMLGGMSVASAQDLEVTHIQSVQTVASASDDFKDGWRWIFYATVPEDETVLNMQFDDWTGAKGSILAQNNVRFYSAQSQNANSQENAIVLNGAKTYGAAMRLNPDSDANPTTMDGRQIEIVVETKIPFDSAGGSYSSSYAIKTDRDATAPTTVTPAPVTITLDNFTQTYDGQGKTFLITTEPANIPVKVVCDRSESLPVAVGVYSCVVTVTDPNYTGEAYGRLTIVP